MLQRGDTVPHVQVRTVAGDTFSYSTIWQQRQLLLVALPDGDFDTYVRELTSRHADFDSLESTCVITRDPVPGLPAPGVLIADRWGEIVHTETARAVADLPVAPQLLEWLAYVRIRCPECEGETR